VGVPLIVLWRGVLYRDLYRKMGIATTYVGPWYLGLLLLGLGESEQILALGLGTAIGGALLGCLFLVWVGYARVVLERLGPGVPAMLSAVPFWVALREALYLQLLWALYRGVADLLTGDPLWAAFISLALVTFSWALDPRRRRDLFCVRGYLVVQDWLLALFTAFLSLTVQALWFLILMHTLWLWFSGQMLAHLARGTAYQAAPRSRQM
jgi:hypothetical protein